MSIILWGKSTSNDKLIHIKNFNKSDEIVCLGCGSKLIAKQGKERIWHFAHHNLANCDGGFETMLHLLAKEVFSSLNIFVLPSKTVFYTEDNLTQSETLVKPLHEITIDDCLVETYLGNIKPDIIIVSKGIKLIVEIAVTHFVDNKKRAEIEKLGISCIEINLSHLKNKYFDFEQLKYEVNNTKNMKWIFHKRECEELKKLENTVKSRLNEIKTAEREKDIADKTLSKNLLDNIGTAIYANFYSIKIFSSNFRKHQLVLKFYLSIDSQWDILKNYDFELECWLYETSDVYDEEPLFECHNGATFVDFPYSQLSEFSMKKILADYHQEIKNEWRKARNY